MEVRQKSSGWHFYRSLHRLGSNDRFSPKRGDRRRSFRRCPLAGSAVQPGCHTKTKLPFSHAGSRAAVIGCCIAVFDLVLLWCRWGVPARLSPSISQWHPRTFHFARILGRLRYSFICLVGPSPVSAALPVWQSHTVRPFPRGAFLALFNFNGGVGMGPLPVARGLIRPLWSGDPFSALRRRLSNYTAL